MLRSPSPPPKWVNILSGAQTRVWSYTGELLSGSGVTVTNLPGNYLGPILRVKSGTKVRIYFHNNLAEDSVIHPHGLRVPEDCDGHPMLAIGPGQTKTYEFEVLDRATCGDVMSVWKRVRQYSKDSVTSIIHGKALHEETMATSSQARASVNGHYLVVFTLAETDYVCNYIVHGGNKAEFLAKFKGAYSDGFDPDIHLRAIGVANQTTMLRGETEEVQRRLKTAMIQKLGEAELPKHFRFFDTICGATQDRQDALEKLLRQPLNLLLVIGGYNSSNTSHLAEMGEARLPTFFIKNAAKMASDQVIRHWDQHKHEEIETRDWLPAGKVTVGITAGASCPNNLIEDAIRRLLELRGISVQDLFVA